MTSSQTSTIFEGVCQMARLILTGFVVQNVRFDFSVSDGLQLLVIFPRAVLNGFAPYILFCKNPRWKYTEFADTCVMNSSCFLKIKMTAGENSSNGILAYCIWWYTFCQWIWIYGHDGHGSQPQAVAMPKKKQQGQSHHMSFTIETLLQHLMRHSAWWPLPWWPLFWMPRDQVSSWWRNCFQAKPRKWLVEWQQQNSKILCDRLWWKGYQVFRVILP